MSIRDQKNLYHLTDITNLPSIFRDGLMPRSSLNTFTDVADPQIILSRRNSQLENYVPFHFFSRSPFDGAVQMAHRNKIFVLIAIRRSFAQSNNWCIIPQHPLSMANVNLMPYNSGMNAIDWSAMDQRDYTNSHSRNVCMAECLSPKTVLACQFASIFVKDQNSYNSVQRLITQYKLTCSLTINSNMFIS